MHCARQHRTGVLLAAIVAFALVDGRASAQASHPANQAANQGTNQAAAREAYDKAVALHSRKQFAAAARQFALADQLIPSDSVLADALDASVTADDSAFGSMLTARAARSPQHLELQRAVSKAKEKFRGRAGRVELHCAGSCETEVDGKPLDPANEGWLTAGPHVVVFTTTAYPSYRDEHRVDVSSADTAVVTFRAPASSAVALAPSSAEPKPLDQEHHGVSPAWFWVGVGVTAAVAGGTIISGISASNTHKDFEDQRCGQQGSTDCLQRADDGKSAVTRTNILLGATAVSAVATTLVGLFLVDWKPRGESAPVSASFSVGPGDARAVLTGSF